MSKYTNTLSAELKGIFGTSFGSATEPTQSLSEAIETALLDERKKSKSKAPNPQRKYDDPNQRKYASKQRVKNDATINKNMDDFHKYADQEGEKSASKLKAKPLSGHDKTPMKGGTVSSGRHNPFKRAANLGTGPGTPPGFKGTGPRHHDQEKCWNCKCGNIYTKGCQCTGTGATKDCPKGHIKHVGIKHDYRQAYNKMYHKWRGRKRAEGDGVTKRIAARGRGR